MLNRKQSHRAKVTQQFLRQNTPDFIAADEWASYSPGLCSSDYCIWDILQDLVYEGRRLPFANIQDLKDAIKNKWNEVTIETVGKSIDNRKTRGKSNLTKSASRRAHSPVRGHPRGSKVVLLNSWGRVSY